MNYINKFLGLGEVVFISGFLYGYNYGLYKYGRERKYKNYFVGFLVALSSDVLRSSLGKELRGFLTIILLSSSCLYYYRGRKNVDITIKNKE